MIYVDTNVLVAYVNNRDEMHDRAVALISSHRGEDLVVSQLVILELYSTFGRVMDVSDIELEALVKYVIRVCGVKSIEVDWDALYQQSLSYANKLKLRTLDLLHVVAAHLIGAKAIMSFDKDINGRSRVIADLLKMNVIGL